MRANLRICLALILCSLGVLLVIFSFAEQKVKPARGLTLAVEKLQLHGPRAVAARNSSRSFLLPAPPAPNTPTFGHPVISGIGGTGFEQAIRIDPSNPNRIYTSTPGTLSANTSWVWRSLDAGKTFKWIPNALPHEGKVAAACLGGGDTELAVDGQGRLYFNDLSLQNFSTARSDDFGVTLTCSNTAVPSVVVDRQWYATDGDPLNGGSVYLTNDEFAQAHPVCGGNPGDNVLVVYRSPIDPLLAQSTAGIQFGPPNRISCDEGIMGNIEVSPIATTLGQPNGLGGYTTLPTPVKHVYIVHDSANLKKQYMARCFPVAFGAATPNVSDPSGMNCTVHLIHDPGPNAKTAGDFPTMAIDTAGNLYVVWEEAPANGNVLTGDVVLKFSRSTDEGRTWTAPLTIDTSGSPIGILHQNVFAWINAGDPGRVNIAWYGTDGTPSGGNMGPDNCTDCIWYLFMTQSLNALDTNPTFAAPILASQHHVHKGTVQSLIGGQDQFASRAFGDFLQMRVGAQGEAHIAYADSNRLFGAAVSHGMYVRQNGGTGLYAAKTINIPSLTPFNFVADPPEDGKLEAAGIISANMPQLDILRSNVAKVTSSPCSAVAPCYRFKTDINNLSLAPTTAQDPDPDLVWLTQWFVPSPADADGGKNYHVYAEAFSDGVNPPALQCYLGESTNLLVGGGATITYAGNDPALPANNCQMTAGQNGSISIYVPISMVTVAGAIDARLHEVTASAMTLPARGNSNPNLAGLGGVAFNLIDAVQGYIFDPNVIRAVSRKAHGAAGTFDVELPLTGTPGIECRRGQGASGNAHQIIVTFPTSITLSSVSITSGVASLSGFSVSVDEVTVDLVGVANAQKVEVTLAGVNNGSTTSNVVIPMNVLLGDTTANGTVNSSDVSQTKAQSGAAVAATNFRTDVTVNGVINSSDVSTVKSKSGTALP